MDYQNIELGNLFLPKAALLLFEELGGVGRYYVERYDIDQKGRPVNAHPLTVQEAQDLAKVFASSSGADRNYLTPAGIMPENILFLDPNRAGDTVIWYTPSQRKPLYFVAGLGLENGVAAIPALLWCVKDSDLFLFALDTDDRPQLSGFLYEAPFFNLYADYRVCLGTVEKEIEGIKSLEEFMALWQSFFFDSYFSHPISRTYSLVKLWKGLVGTERPFPKQILKKTNVTIENLLR